MSGDEYRTFEIPDSPREGLHPWLHVPNEFVEPLGALAIAAGRVELSAAMTYRTFLFPLHSSTKTALLRRKQFSSVLRDTAAMMSTAVVGEVDALLKDEWNDWSRRAQAFMTQRNTWLHSTWALGHEGWVPFSMVQRMSPNSSITASNIESAAKEGMDIASLGARFALRVKAVVTSEAYARRDPNLPATGGIGV